MRVGFSVAFLCLSVFPHNISKVDAASITKLDIEMSHDKSWKPIILGIKKVNGQGHKAQNASLCQSSDGVQYCRLPHM